MKWGSRYQPRLARVAAKVGHLERGGQQLTLADGNGVYGAKIPTSPAVDAIVVCSCSGQLPVEVPGNRPPRLVPKPKAMTRSRQASRPKAARSNFGRLPCD